jgi:hypothetical protein
LVDGTSNIIPFRRPFFFLIQADLWKQMGMKALLNKAGFSKRSGSPIYELVYVLVLWVWLKKDSNIADKNLAIQRSKTMLTAISQV